MKRIINYKSFNIFTIEKDVWDFDYHNHNFYEIILVEEGEGLHYLNHVKFRFKKGDVFLLTPSDAHKFEIEKKIKFIYIKYTEQFLLDLLSAEKNTNWKDAIRLTLFQKPILYESIIKDPWEKEALFRTSKTLLHEFQSNNVYSDKITINLFSVMITIITRNLNRIGKKNWLANEGERIEKILSYINIHSLDNEKMKIENLALQFMMSKNYISLYVKKNTGHSIQHYILQNKISIAEKLLTKSKFNINEIATNLGFNDASHFNKFFKKYKKSSPTEYRKKVNL